MGLSQHDAERQALRRLRLAATISQRAERRLVDAMRAARDVGWSLRVIAGECGVSHEHVRNVLGKVVD